MRRAYQICLPRIASPCRRVPNSFFNMLIFNTLNRRHGLLPSVVEASLSRRVQSKIFKTQGLSDAWRKTYFFFVAELFVLQSSAYVLNFKLSDTATRFVESVW